MIDTKDIRTRYDEIKKNIVSFGYRHGIQDYFYDSFTLGYTRCF